MTSSWKTLEIAFHEALLLDASQREQFVAEFAKEHPELATQLRALLAADAANRKPPGDIVSAVLRLLSGRQR